MFIYVQVGLVAALVGGVYALIRVKSPAPPFSALVALAGMLFAGTVLGAL